MLSYFLVIDPPGENADAPEISLIVKIRNCYIDSTGY
jgi:hypothetical protein